MRIVLAIHNYFNDPHTGAMRTIRTLMGWLREAGHDCHVVCTARIDTPVQMHVLQHLRSLGVSIDRREAPTIKQRKAGRIVKRKLCPIVHYTSDAIPVSLLLTEHNHHAKPDKLEGRQFIDVATRLIKRVEPDVFLTYGNHPIIPWSMKAASELGVTTVVTVRNHGYEHAEYFRYANHVFTCSDYLSGHYREKIGLISEAIAPALYWDEIVAEDESTRSFLTFVNPSLKKGATMFARIADMIGSRRPDIPVMVMQSGGNAEVLNRMPGIDFTKYPQIMAAPAVDQPKEYFALTRLLLAPSVWQEPFGRVAAEAMINGIPAIVSDRGGLPDVVGRDEDPEGDGGRILPLPDWMAQDTPRLPGEADAQPWVDAICRLWDDEALYRTIGRRGHKRADRLFSEDVLRAQYLDYFTSREPRAKVIAAT